MRESVKQPIYCMAYPRQIALQKFTDLSPQLSYHVIKFVVYQNQRPETLNHWLTEMSTWIHTANLITCKSKLKKQDYLNTLFGEFGDARIDAQVNLLEFQRKFVNVHFNPYPEFEITAELIDQLFDTYSRIIQCVLPRLVSHEVLSVDEWEHILQPILYL